MESNQDVFISHSSADSKLAYAMCDYLEEKGIRCWVAPRDVQGGTEYAEAIIMGIRSCKIMVVLFNKNANDSIYVKNEVERAFNYKSILIPFKVDQTIPSATLELFLGSVHSLDATKGNPEDCFDLLYKNCKKVIGKKERVIEENPVLPLTTETKERVSEPFSSDTNTNERLWSYWVSNLTTKTTKYGSINHSGAIVIQPMFDKDFEFSDELAKVSVNDKWGFIDKKGNWVIQPMFDDAWNFLDELAKVSVNDEWGFIDKKGNWVIQPMFDDPSHFSDELAVVPVNEKYGFIDKKGNWVIQPMFDYASSFSDELARVKVNQKYGFIDKKGNWVIQPMFDFAQNSIDELARVMVNEKYGFIDKKGNWVIQPMFDDAENFSDELALASVNGKWGYIDKKGNWVIQPMFDSARDFIDELALVTVNEKCGYIDKKGNWVLQPTMYGNSTFYDYEFYSHLNEINSDDFNLEDYFGNVNSKLKIKNQIDPKKVQNFIENIDDYNLANYVTHELWVFYDKTFWQNGKEGFLISSDADFIYLTVCANGLRNSYVFDHDDGDADLNYIINIEIVNEQLVISISNILKDYWDFPFEINNALYEFFQEEIFPRKSL